MTVLLQVIDAASTPLLALIVYIVWNIKTNDLPHIYERLGKIEVLLKRDEDERG